VCPERAAFLNEANCACRPRPKIDSDIFAEINDLVMSARQRHVQEALRIEYG
jgi:hypothetical protein